MKSTPKFSIITVCCNEERRIKKTATSVLEQDYDNYEYIIQDGDSIDNTVQIVEEIAKNYLRNVRIFTEKDSGLYDAMNRALLKAKGDYVCFMNSGDSFQSDSVLSYVSKEIDLNSDVDFFYGDAIISFPSGEEYAQVIAPPVNELLDEKKLVVGDISIIHQAVFASRKCFEKMLFNTDYLIRAELDWYYRCIKENRKFYRLKYLICNYELGGLSESINAILRGNDETRKIIEAYGFDSGSYFEKDAPIIVAQYIYKLIYREWLLLKQKGCAIGNYIENRGYNNVAVFGYSELGCHLIYELMNSDIKVRYIIESKERHSYNEIPILSPNSMKKMKDVDLIIITAVIQSNDIISKYSNFVHCPMISLDKLLAEMIENLR